MSQLGVVVLAHPANPGLSNVGLSAMLLYSYELEIQGLHYFLLRKAAQNNVFVRYQTFKHMTNDRILHA
jgi:hypothetical protein